MQLSEVETKIREQDREIQEIKRVICELRRPEYLTREQFAVAIGRALNTVNKYVSEGRVNVLPSGLIPSSEVKRFAEEYPQAK